LIRDLGISYDSLTKPIIPADRKDIGKRLILAPSRFDATLNEKDIRVLIASYPSKGVNTVVLVPSDLKAISWVNLGAELVNRDNIQEAIQKLKASKNNFMVFVNRYDGIDLHNDLCRVLVIDGLPKYNTLKEKYTEIRLDSLLAGNKAQIIEQGLGRA